MSEGLAQNISNIQLLEYPIPARPRAARHKTVKCRYLGNLDFCTTVNIMHNVAGGWCGRMLHLANLPNFPKKQ